MIRLAILGSTRGTNMLAIINAIRQQQLSASIEIVLSNKQDALILDKAREHHLNEQFVNPEGLERAEFDRKISDLLHQNKIELVVLIGYMRLLSADFVMQWHSKIINVHPSLLPAFAGKMDLDVHQSVLDEGISETGCTIHYVTKEVDKGPVLLQKRCAVLETDTAQTLKERVQSLEGIALVEAIQHIALQKGSPIYEKAVLNPHSKTVFTRIRTYPSDFTNVLIKGIDLIS